MLTAHRPPFVDLQAYAGSVTSITNAVNDWAAEVKDYNPNKPTYRCAPAG